jgi:hypothetical protein
MASNTTTSLDTTKRSISQKSGWSCGAGMKAKKNVRILISELA